MRPSSPPNPRRILSVAALTMALALAASPAHAQLGRVVDLNRQGMDAYANLEIEEALTRLQEAVELAQSSGVTGGPLARTYINLGVVTIGGLADNGAALNYFVEALRADPNVELDPLTSTPEVRSVFTLARNRVGSGGGETGNTGTGNTGTGNTGTPSGPGNIPHAPAAEQLESTSLPIFVEAPDDAPVGEIFVYYRAPGMRDFRRTPMRRIPGGFGAELPCEEMMPPEVRYYVVAFDTQGSPLGNAGTSEQPFHVPIVTARQQPPPALPGQAPPEQCVENECPPGMECGTERLGGLGDTCRETSECRSGLTCEDNFCVANRDEDDDDDDSGSSSEMPRFFAHIGFSFGVGYANAGRPADSLPPTDNSVPEDVRSDAGIRTRFSNGGSYSYVPDGFSGCPDTGTASTYCVRVEQPGFLPALAPRIQIGYWVHPRVGISAHFRYQINAGEGPLSAILVGGRLHAHITNPAVDGFHVDAFAGASGGQIQLQPPQNGDPEPYIVSGLMSVDVGFTIGYRINKYFGFVLAPEAHFMLPTFLFAADFTLSAAVGF